MKNLLFVLCFGLLVGCGASAKSASTGAGTGTQVTANAPASQLLPPHMANIKGESFDGEVPITMNIGETYIFTGDSKGWQVATVTPELVHVEQGGTKDTYETNPGFTALAAGKAVITVTSPTNTILTVMVTIK